jgi:hypothetical protein
VSGAAEDRATNSAAQQAIAKAIGAALQADVRQALAELRAVDASQLSGVEARLRNCVLARFGQETSAEPLGPKLDPFTERVVEHYLSYWRTALLDPAARPKALAALETKLRSTLESKVTVSGFEAVEQELRRQLNARDYHVLLGQTGLLQEFMVWRQQTSVTYRVQGEDPASPHSYANRRVLRDVRRSLDLGVDADLNQPPLASLQQAAADLLRADGTRLRSKSRR